VSQILSHTPIWVFGLFVVLVVFGLQQTRNRNVKLVLAYFLPAGMIALSLAGVLSSFGVHPVPIALWFIGLVVTTTFIYKLFPLKGVTFHPERKHFFVPGSWLPFVVIMAIFFAKYAVGVMHGLNSPLLANQSFILLLSFAYGCFSGYFASRAVALHGMQKAKMEERSE